MDLSSGIGVSIGISKMGAGCSKKRNREGSYHENGQYAIEETREDITEGDLDIQVHVQECLDMLDGNMKHRQKEFAAVQCEDAEACAHHRKRGFKKLSENGVHVLVVSPERELRQDGERRYVLKARLLPYTSGMTCVAISYRHTGEQCDLVVEGGGGLNLDGTPEGSSRTFQVSTNAIKALTAAVRELPLQEAIWLDLVCIQGSGHTLQMALNYMGFVYSAFRSFSQIHWRAPEDFQEYSSRGWVMQEFLVAESFLTPHLHVRLLTDLEHTREAGLQIFEGFKVMFQGIGSYEGRKKGIVAISKAFKAFQSSLGLATSIASYLSNDTHNFWAKGVEKFLRYAKQDNKRQGSAYVTELLIRSKQCMCPPKICLLTSDVILRALGMQTPNSNILGRLEYCYVTSSFSFESDRSAAIFGVYNALSGENVSVPVFAGIWPALRGAKVTAQRGSSGLGEKQKLLVTRVSEDLEVAACVLYEEDITKRRILLLALPTGSKRATALWTYSNLIGDGEAVGQDFPQALVFSDEIDTHFDQKEGTMRKFLERVSEPSTRPSENARVNCAPQSRYATCLQIGERVQVFD